jgi:hypothetical protein
LKNVVGWDRVEHPGPDGRTGGGTRGGSGVHGGLGMEMGRFRSRGACWRFFLDIASSSVDATLLYAGEALKDSAGAGETEPQKNQETAT